MAIQEIRVGYTEKDVKGEDVRHEAGRTIGIQGLKNVRTARVYRLEGINEEEAQKLQDTLFCEKINQVSTLNEPLITDAPHVVEVAYQPGVMNPESVSIAKAAEDLGI